MEEVTTEELNRIAADTERAIDTYLAGRKLNRGLWSSLFLAVERRARAGLQPAFTDEHAAIIDRFAEDKS